MYLFPAIFVIKHTKSCKIFQKNHTLFIQTVGQKYEIHTKTEKSYHSGKRACSVIHTHKQPSS